MNRILSFFVVAAVALSLAMGMGVGTIAAQEDANDSDVYPGDQGPNAPDDQGDENATDQDDDRNDGAGELEDRENATVAPNEDFVREIDSDTRIVDWSYEPGMFTIKVEADKETEISVTEGGDYEEGAGSFNYREFELDEGSNTVTMPVTDRQGAGVAIATRRSLEQGGGVTLSIGQVEQNPFRHFGGESGLFSGIGMTVGLSVVGAWYVVRSEESGVIKA